MKELAKTVNEKYLVVKLQDAANIFVRKG